MDRNAPTGVRRYLAMMEPAFRYPDVGVPNDDDSCARLVSAYSSSNR